VPLFQALTGKRDRDALKAALIEETFKPGDVIFNYGKLLFLFGFYADLS